MKRKRLLLAFLIGIPLLLGFLYFENHAITVSEHRVQSPKIPRAFNGYRIVQISDLHSQTFGKNQKNLIDKIIKENPDLIVITGDLFDDTKEKYVTESMELVRQATSIAPVYFVTGNHEWYTGRFDELERQLSQSGVKILHGSHTRIYRGGASIVIAGIDDPAKNGESYGARTVLEKELTFALEGTVDKDFKVLLAHRPELLSIYKSKKVDLVFSGHAHGGQFRIPFVGGLIAPGQGFFPKYTSGTYKEEGTVMVVSRGLGNSIIPQRILNRPELVTVELRSN